MALGNFNPIMSEELPKWLNDAKISENNKRNNFKMKRKSKKIFNDWRFWAGVIVTTAFMSAFYTVYQQNNGFTSELNNFPILSNNINIPLINNK